MTESKSIYIVYQSNEDSADEPIAHCRTLEDAKDYLRGRLSPMFTQSSDPKVINVAVSKAYYTIAEVTLK